MEWESGAAACSHLVCMTLMPYSQLCLLCRSSSGVPRVPQGLKVLAAAQSTMNMMSFSSSYRGGRSVPGQPRDAALDG